MKFKSILLTMLLCIVSAIPCEALAQGSSKSQRVKWMKEVRSYKYEFLIKETGMTKEQQEQFIPVYEAMEKEIFAINKEAREMERKISTSKEPVSETEYEAAATAIAKVSQKEGDIEMNYFTKFEKILTKKQLFLLKRAENKFTQNILNHHRRAGK